MAPKEARATTKSLRRHKEEDPWGQADVALERTLIKVRRGERFVSLFNSGPSPKGVGDAGALQLAQALRERRHQPDAEGLVSLQLRGNEIGDEGLVSLAAALEGLAGQGLRKLDFGSNKIANAGADRLAKALHCGSCLRLLDLRGNQIGDQGAASLAEALAVQPELEELQLGGNKVGEVGAKALAAAVAKHLGLQALHLTGNPMGNAGAAHLAEAFGEGCGLKSLQLESTKIGDAGASALAAALLRQPGLRELALGSNAIADAGARDLAKALESHGMLRSLGLAKNKITDHVILEFVAVLIRLSKEDINCDLSGNPSKRFNEATLGDVTVAARTARSISKRGLKLFQMLTFFKEYTGVGAIDGAATTTQHVVDTIVIPETTLYGVCYADFYHGSLAEMYVVHSWKALFSDLLLALAMHATGYYAPKLDPHHEMYNRYPASLDRRYFVDVFCIDQARKHPEGDPRCETDKFDFVLQEFRLRNCETLVAMDRDYTPLTRTWCLVEVHHCAKLGMPVHVSLGPVRPMPRRRKGLRLSQAAASVQKDQEMLLEELKQRGVEGDKFDETILKPLEKQSRERYDEVYPTMPAELRQECDWVGNQDDAREEMAIHDKSGDGVKLRQWVDAAVASRVEEKTVVPRRKRLAELELRAAIPREELHEMRQCYQFAVEENTADEDLMSAGKKTLDHLEEIERRRLAGQALIQNCAEGKKLIKIFELATKKRLQEDALKAKLRAEGTWVEEVPVRKTNDERLAEKAQTRKTEAEQKAVVRSVLQALEEAVAAKVPQDVQAVGAQCLAELKMRRAVKAVLKGIIDAEAKRVAVIRQAAAAEARALARAAARAEKEAAKAAAIAKGEEVEEDDFSDEDEEEDEAREEVEEFIDKPEAWDEGTIESLCDTLLEARDVGVPSGAQDFGKAFLLSLDREVWMGTLRSELDFYIKNHSQATLRKCIGEVVDAGFERAKEAPCSVEDVQVTVPAAPEAAAGPPLVLPESTEVAGDAQPGLPTEADPVMAAEETPAPAPEAEETPAPAPVAADETPAPAPAPAPEAGVVAEETPALAPAAVVVAERSEVESADDGVAVLEEQPVVIDPAEARALALADLAQLEKARTRLAYLVMADTMEERDLEGLLEVVPAAQRAGVQDSDTKLGWRLIHELQLAEEVEIAKPVLKVTGNQSQQKVIKALRKRLDQAKESEVEVQPYLLAARLLASLEIAEGIRFNNPEALAKCIEEGLAAGLKEHEVRQGKALLAKIEVARASSSEDPDELRGVMALAKEVGISETSKEMVVALNRLAFLELRAATAETNIEVLRAAIDFARENNVEKDMIAKAVYKWTLLLLDEAMLEYDLEKLLLCMQDAKELKAPKEVIEAAKVKLRNIDAKAHMEWVTVELEEALAVAKESGARSGPIREAIENAIRAKVDHSEIEPAQHRLSFLELGEVIRNLDATKDMVQKTIQRAKAVGYEESGEEAERRMGEAYIRIQQIEAEAVQKERRENMLIAAKGVDPFTLQAAIDAARECGVDEESIKIATAAKAKMDQ